MGFILPVSNVTSDLVTFADAYLHLGYSVIPVYGDSQPERSKVAAVAWTAYQSRRPTLTQVQQWFLKYNFAGIAIVTGRVSNLVVLDFDTPELFDQFCRTYPPLAETKIIQTRRGYHLYFDAAYRSIPSRKGQGIDLLAEGCYVVAYPTIINGSPYRVFRGGALKALTVHDLQQITVFIDQAASQPHSQQPPPPTHLATLPQLSDADVQAIYRSQVGQGRGRNQSLFKVACTARDHGWSQPAVQAALVNLHTHTTSRSHLPETTAQRQREALHTVQSAFSRPARPPHPLTNSPQLPNRVREQLYALKLTCVVRTLEGLREKGIQPGQIFTRQQAHTLLKGLVGRNSIDTALNALASDGQRLIARGEPPPLEPPPASVDAAKDSHPPDFKKCFFEGTTKPGELKRGVKSRLHIMPSNNELCPKLGIHFSGSDLIQTDDLSSAKKTRQATHREFIRRRPGQYYRHWLAKRLGVSVRTVQRYDLELHMQVQPMFHQEPISWGTLHHVPDELIPGVFLMDDQNRRYPAKREIAARLLPKVYALYLMHQRANFYSLDPPHVVFNQVWKHRQKQQEQIEQRIMVEQGRAEDIPAAPIHPATQPRSGLPPPAQLSAPALPARTTNQLKTRLKAVPKLTKRRARQPLPDRYQEALAQRVYHTLNQRTSDRKQRISQASARRAVFTYGTQAVENALKCLVGRRHILKPAGFFMTILRSEQRRTR